MSTYPNLTQLQIDTTTIFFNKLDTNSSGVVSIQQIIDECLQNFTQAQKIVPSWLTNLSLEYTPERILTSDDYYSKKQYNIAQVPGQTLSYPDLYLDFSDIDTDNNGQITFQQLYDKYMSLIPEPQVFYISKAFIELIKSEYNLTDQSTITLEQLLTYENDHNITRYWPI